ncbi:maleylpyruvate isomerase N-terminal domain-containing protein [Saccharothrix xinjiangensis]|uniref:Maleylpyruvate isomerase N-terminal domain-containing protein n=1 Tax=Saccharothrix xinjiangensis TaxID=204798 RepID=A0ABV9XXP0_9PSEU
MELELTDQRWEHLREAVAGASTRFARLLADCHRPDRRAVGDWSVAETAAHTAVVARLNAGLVSADPAPLGVPDLDAMWREASFGDFTRINSLSNERFPYRDGGSTGRDLVERVDVMLARSADLDPRELRTWLGGARLPVATMVAHQLNEVLLHGFDIAEALGAPWPIPPEEAALAFDLFLMPLIGGDTGALFGGGAHRGRRVLIEFRSAHTTPVLVEDGDGRIAVTAPDRAADATITFEPAALLLQIFRRTRLLATLASRGVSVSGPHPWAALDYLRRTRTP